MATISLVVPVHDQGDHARDFIEHVKADAGTSVEIIVVDDQCTDGSCHRMPSDALILRTKRLRGYGGSIHFGVSRAQGDTLLICHPRTRFSPLGLKHFIAKASECQGITYPSITREDGTAYGFAAKWRMPTRLESHHGMAWQTPAFAVNRLIYNRISSWLRRLPLALSLPLCCRAFRIPFVMDDACTCTFLSKSDKTPRPLQPSIRASPSMSVIITAHNEGTEVRRTVESVRANTFGDCEIIVIDDGSTDGSCDGLTESGTRIIRHEQRMGIAYSRNEGCQAAQGDAFVFLDGHQRVSRGCLNACSDIAIRQGAIVLPDVRPLGKRFRHTAHGAWFHLSSNPGYISASWEVKRPRTSLSRVGSLRAPGYVIGRHTYKQVEWVQGLRSWGGSEAAISLKAFFLDIDILHLCGFVTWHLFRPRHPYPVKWDDIWWNHALITRICFEDDTWYSYWWPEVFRKHINAKDEEALSSPPVLAQHTEFLTRKVRPDREFWRGSLHVECPRHVNSNHVAVQRG